jgi:transitional endoplasmic reticulum ATPase
MEIQIPEVLMANQKKKPSTKPRIHPFKPSANKLDPLARQCMALALKMVLELEKVMSRSNVLGNFDSAVAEALGWEEEWVCMTTPADKTLLRTLLRKRLAQLEGVNASRFEANLAILSERLGLSEADRKLLRVAALLPLNNVTNSIADEIHCPIPRQFFTFLAGVTGLLPSQVEQSLRENAPLVRTGLLNAGDLRVYHHDLIERLGVLDDLPLQLSECDFTVDGFKAPNVVPMPPSTLQIAQYPHLKREVSLIRDVLRAAVAKGARGINILLHGAPGTGKTQLARALVEAAGGIGSEIKAEEGDRTRGDGSDGNARLRKYALTQRLLNSCKGHVIVFDEVEDVLASDGDMGLFLFGAGQGLAQKKGWKVSLLESNAVPAIWLCNNIWRIDPALQRRFTFCLEVPVPPRSVRLDLLRKIGRGDGNESLLNKLADSDQLTPADVERVNRVLTLCPPADGAIWREQVLVTLGARPDGVDTSALIGARTPCEIRYEPKWINASPGIADIAVRLKSAGEGRLCFAGPPGTGKTAFARHLAHELDRPLLSKKASDLLSPYLGETEQKLAGAFREARRDGAVLLIDEADSFLQDRRVATRSWEITQVNEVLKQLEEHTGYVILSTNLYDRLDPAVLRRLDVKVMFGYLPGEHVPEVFRAAGAGLAMPDAQVTAFCATAQWSAVKDLAMGDVAASMRQARLTSDRPTPEVLFSALKEQLEHRNRLQGRKIGFC